MGVSLIALVVLGFFLLFGLGAIVIGILASGTRSPRAEAGADTTTSSPTWFTGLFAGGAGSEGQQRHPQHQEPGHDSTSGSEGGAGAGGTGDAAADSGGSGAGGPDAGGGSDGGGSSGGGD